MKRPLLELRGITKSFFGVTVLEDITLALDRGRVLGLVGENGAGKSTLMNVLGGVLPPDAGDMTIDGRPYRPAGPREATERGIAFIHQELNLFSNLSIAENIFVDRFPRLRWGRWRLPLVDRGALRERARELLHAVGLDAKPDTRVGALSPGERQQVEIARALGVDARLVILDEPTTSLTSRENERLFALMERLQAREIAMIYISHDLGDVLRLSDDVLILRDGRIAGEGAARDFTEGEVIRRMVGRDLEPRATVPDAGEKRASGEGRKGPDGEAETILEVRGLSQPGVLRDVSFALARGEVLGLAGLMGSGRTELARMLYGLDPFDEGEILLEGRPLRRPSPRRSIARGLVLVTEDRRDEGLLLEAAVEENIALASLPSLGSGPFRWIDRRLMRRRTGEAARIVHLRAADPERQPAKTLSGGNQQKTVLARWLMKEPSCFILDEPTRGIDVGAKEEVYALIRRLASRGAGILLISSEIEELLELADRILVMKHGEISDEARRDEFDRERILRSALSTESAE